VKQGAETAETPIPMTEDGSDAAGSGFGWGESDDATGGDDRWWFAALPANDVTAAGLTHPAPLLSSSTLRAQGLTVGATLNY